MSISVPTLIAEERTLLREGLTSLLEGTRYQVIASAESVTEMAPQKLEQPSLIIVGVSAGVDKTLAAIRKVRHLWPRATLFMVADGSDRCDTGELMRNGADGCILDIASQAVLVKALDLALLGQRVIVVGTPVVSEGQALAQVVATAGTLDGRKLSDREREILACLARGQSNKAIARQCYIAETTVKAHLKAIARKIAVRNRTQAAIWAIDNGLAASDRPVVRSSPRH